MYLLSSPLELITHPGSPDILQFVHGLLYCPAVLSQGQPKQPGFANEETKIQGEIS